MYFFKKKRKKENIVADQRRRENRLSRIKDIMNPPPPKPVSNITEDSGIRYSLSDDAYSNAEHVISKWKEEYKTCTFQQELINRIDESSLSSVEFYKKAHIDRKLFSAIKNNILYYPKKETAIACCLALNLDIFQTEALLKKAGYALSDAKQWDVLVKHCIESRYYDIDDVNYILDHFGEKPIGC